ncbi:hypothetical protein B0H19DRAFT_1067327 [Mycena capillaripes]|nr:hypothetical protein B0H19DRAFT_1067327 [Mycena capillaripes]
MPTYKHIYIVYEPINAHGPVPVVLQKFAGFSHAKLVVLSRGKITDTDSTGKVYDIWKEGKSNIGFGDEDSHGRTIAVKWDGYLKEGEQSVAIGQTTFTDARILKAAHEVIQKMGSYNLVFRNCEDFALTLSRAIAPHLALADEEAAWLQVQKVLAMEYPYN